MSIVKCQVSMSNRYISCFVLVFTQFCDKKYGNMDNKPSLSQYFADNNVPPASQFFDEIGTSPTDMIQSIYLGSNESMISLSIQSDFFYEIDFLYQNSCLAFSCSVLGNQTTSANLFPTTMTTSFTQQAVSDEVTFSNDMPTVSTATALPATSLPDPSTFFDNIGPEPQIGPVKSGITSPHILTEAIDGLSIKVK